MAKAKKPPSLKRRTYSAYRHQCERARAAGKRIRYTLDQLRAAVEWALAAGSCPYCGQGVNVGNFALDHATPISRDGSWALRNVTVCCRRCNEVKGSLTAGEYEGLCRFMSNWSAAVAAQDVTRRLRAGGRVHRG